MEKREVLEYLQQLKVEDRKNVDTEDQDKTDADERKPNLRMVVHIIQLNVSSCRIITPQQPPQPPLLSALSCVKHTEIKPSKLPELLSQVVLSTTAVLTLGCVKWYFWFLVTKVKL